MIEGVKLYPLKIIEVPKGNIFHAIKATDEGFEGFGEAYFSSIEPGAVKGWKRHNRIPLNLIVPYGAIRFVIYDNRDGSPSFGQYEDITLSPANNYQRLYIAPGLWMAFQGVANEVSLLLDIIPLPHNPAEADRLDIHDIPYSFNK